MYPPVPPPAPDPLSSIDACIAACICCRSPSRDVGAPAPRPNPTCRSPPPPPPPPLLEKCACPPAGLCGAKLKPTSSVYKGRDHCSMNSRDYLRNPQQRFLYIDLYLHLLALALAELLAVHVERVRAQVQIRVEHHEARVLFHKVSAAGIT